MRIIKFLLLILMIGGIAGCNNDNYYFVNSNNKVNSIDISSVRFYDYPDNLYESEIETGRDYNIRIDFNSSYYPDNFIGCGFVVTVKAEYEHSVSGDKIVDTVLNYADDDIYIYNRTSNEYEYQYEIIGFEIPDPESGYVYNGLTELSLSVGLVDNDGIQTDESFPGDIVYF